MAALAGIGRQPLRCIEAVARHGDGGRLGAEQMEVGLEDVGHDEVGTFVDGGIDAGHRVFDVALELVQGAPVVHQAAGVGTGMRKGQVVMYGHFDSPLGRECFSVGWCHIRQTWPEHARCQVNPQGVVPLCPGRLKI